MDRLKGKVAVVTGGATGIGRATSLLFAREGAAVAIFDVDEREAQKTVNEILNAGGHAGFWRTNVTSEKDVQQNIGQVKAQFGKIDVLVNNAGIPGAGKPTHELTEEEWDRVMAIDVKGVFFCTKHVIPCMKANGGGAIVNISSVYGLVGGGNDPEYHAAKAAVRMMAKYDATLYGADRIRVNSIHPGHTRTNLTQKLATERAPGGMEGLEKMLSKMQSLPYFGEPEDIAWGALYLASDESRYVTGTELVIDGGYTAL